jgi:phosphocarrier protein FPr
MGKAAHLATPEAGGPPTSVVASEMTGTFTVGNRHGLHARPAARLVSEVRGLDATVSLVNLTTGAGPVPAASLSRVATLGALQGHTIEVRASGPQSQEAVEHVLTLARRQFDEPAGPAHEATAAAAAGPVGASPGIAVGPVRKLAAVLPDLDDEPTGDPTAEWRRVVEAVAEVRRDIEHVRVVTAREVGADEASIFDAHLSLLADAEMLGDVKQRISGGAGAARAWSACLADIEQQWAGLPDPYLRERAEDVHAVGSQVLRALTGARARQVLAEGVMVARDLTPAEAAELDPDVVKGVVLAFGTASSHAAILARARDIPLVVAAGRELLDVAEGTPIVMDGSTGEIHVAPSSQTLEEFQSRALELAERRALHHAAAEEPVVSADGVGFQVGANLGSVADARAALAAGADSAGLVRTEFLFLSRSSAPTVDEQEAEYAALSTALDGRPATLRTLDVGGDKPLSYVAMPKEQNPFLGVRGIRLSLERRDLLRDQLEAICRTARRFPTNVMFPMVSTLGELLDARQVLAEAAGSAGLPELLRVGMMVEVPAAALKIESFLPHLDFVSIGTNDLTQYTLAAERGNGALAAINDPLDPGVLELIRRVCRAAAGRVEVAVCGEAAADELALPILVGLGVRELSVSPHAVPRVKAMLRELDVQQCSSVAQQALALAGPDDVRKLVLAMVSGTSER